MLQTRLLILFFVVLVPCTWLAGLYTQHYGPGWFGLGLVLGLGMFFALGLFLVWLMFLLALRAPDGQRARLSRWQRASLLLREWWAAMRLYLWHHLFAPGSNRTSRGDGTGQSAIVVMVHGYFCNVGFFARLAKRLNRSGWRTVRLHMWHKYDRVDSSAARLRDEIHRIHQQFPERSIVLVGHSMGGVACVAALCQYPLPVAGAVVLAAPLHGTLFGQWRLLGAPGGWRQPGIGDICRVENDQGLPADKLHCVFSWHDNIVIPQSSARLQGVDETPLQRVGHLEMAFSREAHDAIIKAMENLVDKGLYQ